MEIEDFKMPVNYLLNKTIGFLFKKIHKNDIKIEKIKFKLITEFGSEYSCRLFAVPDNRENIDFRFRLDEKEKLIFINKYIISGYDKLRIIFLFSLLWFDKLKFNESKCLISIFKKYINPEITKLEYNK